MSIEYDLFNGDADGIISVHQYRMFKPKKTNLVSGIKRDVTLLRHCDSIKNTKINVFDISVLSNEEYIDSILKKNNKIIWYDHHETGGRVSADNIKISVDTDPNTCTNIIVDKTLGGIYRPWTICGAFGDNLHDKANELNISFNEEQMKIFQEVGETLNYNGYGLKIEDLNAHPKDVLLDLMNYESPFEYHSKSELFNKIKNQMKLDREKLESSEVLYRSHAGEVLLLPPGQEATRYSGIFSNKKSTDNPDLAFAIITHGNNNTYRVSIRSPQNNPFGASELALRFPSGGGREKAAGINELKKVDLKKFIYNFCQVYANHELSILNKKNKK